MKKSKVFKDGLLSNNAVFALFLGMCPTLATTKTFMGALGMGLAVIVTLILTNVLVSLVRKIVPNEIRIPVLIVIITTVVSIVEMSMTALMFDLAQTLGVYLSLVAVNCIILGRAEAFAMKNTVADSFFDALGTGLGFLGGLLILSFFREFIGTGGLVFSSLFTGKVLWSFQLIPDAYTIPIFTQSSGAFIMFGLLVGLLNFIIAKVGEHKKNKAAVLKAAEVGE